MYGVATVFVPIATESKMTQHNIHSSRIDRRAVKQGARPVIRYQVTDEKLATEKINKLLKTKKTTIFGTINVQTLNKEGKISELIASAITTRQDVISIQEHRVIHNDLIKEEVFGKWRLLTCSAWKNTVNAANGGIGMLLRKDIYNTLSSIKKISPRIMTATFQGNPQTTIITCYSPTNVSDETETERFYADLSSLTRQIPKHNVLIISGDFNAQLGQNDNGNFPYSLHQNTNRNGNMLKNYILENNLICLNTHFQKRRGHSWTHTSPNASNSQIDYVIINRKWKNSAINCRANNYFISVATDHRIVSAYIRLSLRANKRRKSNRKNFEWSELRNNSTLRSPFVIKVQNRFEALQNTSLLPTANSIYTNFEISCKEIAAETIPLKPKTKRRIPWENLNIRNKRKILHEATQQKDNNPTIENISKTCNAQK